jgi:CRP-like cAMP-binding protein
MNISARLRKLPAFGHFDDAALDLFASSLDLREYAEGETIASEKDGNRFAFILLEGSVRVVDRTGAEAQAVGHDECGELLGLLSVLLDSHREVEVRASAATKVAVLTLYTFDLLYRHSGPASIPFCRLVSGQLASDCRRSQEAFFAANAGQEGDDFLTRADDEALDQMVSTFRGVN